MDVSADQLLIIIGRKEVEMVILQSQIQQQQQKINELEEALKTLNSAKAE